MLQITNAVEFSRSFNFSARLICTMEPSGRVLLAVLCLISLAVCVLGRPPPTSASPQYSSVEVLGNSSLHGSNRNLWFLPFGTLEVPWRRSLRGGGGRGRGGGGGGGGGSGGVSFTVGIIIYVSCSAFFLLCVVLGCCCVKEKNPNGRPTGCALQANQGASLDRK